MPKKHNMDIVPMRRRKFGVSRTAVREQDWAYKLKMMPIKAERQKFLRKIGKKASLA